MLLQTPGSSFCCMTTVILERADPYLGQFVVASSAAVDWFTEHLS